MGGTSLLLYHASRTSQKSQTGALARLQPYQGKAVAADSVADGFLWVRIGNAPNIEEQTGECIV